MVLQVFTGEWTEERSLFLLLLLDIISITVVVDWALKINYLSSSSASSSSSSSSSSSPWYDLRGWLGVKSPKLLLLAFLAPSPMSESRAWQIMRGYCLYTLWSFCNFGENERNQDWKQCNLNLIWLEPGTLKSAADGLATWGRLHNTQLS